MNGDRWEELEDLLRAQPLREPSKDLDLRIAAIGSAAPAGQRKWLVVAACAAVLALAASLLIMIDWRGRGEGPVEKPLPDVPEIATKEPTAPAPAAPVLAEGVRIERTWSAIADKNVVLTQERAAYGARPAATHPRGPLDRQPSSRPRPVDHPQRGNGVGPGGVQLGVLTQLPSPAPAGEGRGVRV